MRATQNYIFIKAIQVRKRRVFVPLPEMIELGVNRTGLIGASQSAAAVILQEFQRLKDLAANDGH